MSSVAAAPHKRFVFRSHPEGTPTEVHVPEVMRRESFFVIEKFQKSHRTQPAPYAIDLTSISMCRRCILYFSRFSNSESKKTCNDFISMIRDYEIFYL